MGGEGFAKNESWKTKLKDGKPKKGIAEYENNTGEGGIRTVAKVVRTTFSVGAQKKTARGKKKRAKASTQAGGRNKKGRGKINQEGPLYSRNWGREKRTSTRNKA